MVSLRRRKLLGYFSGIVPSEADLPRYGGSGNISEKPNQHIKVRSVNSLLFVDPKQPNEINNSSPNPESSNISGASSSKEVESQKPSGQGFKRRKRYRRKHFENQEACIMRGVYLKNMKWQAAIKVEKKQIHLGTVESQEEAAHLYDRAAFLCGRETNFELSEEVKQELRQFTWDEFLIMTRNAIINKKYKRRVERGSKHNHETHFHNGNGTESMEGNAF